MGTSFSKLTKFPRNRLIEQELIRCRASELDLLGVFGEPTSQTAADELDPTFFWDIEWSCELVMSLQFKQLTEMLTIRLDAPDVDHALRHLGFTVHDLWTLEADDPDRLAELGAPLPHDAELWRTDQRGEKEQIATHLTERDAYCQRDELNDEGSGNKYFVIRVES
jgi:hypothetical protein